MEDYVKECSMKECSVSNSGNLLQKGNSTIWQYFYPQAISLSDHQNHQPMSKKTGKKEKGNYIILKKQENPLKKQKNPALSAPIRLWKPYQEERGVDTEDNGLLDLCRIDGDDLLSCDNDSVAW